MPEAVSTKVLAQLEKWDSLIDNARYLGVEHRHKEKEYGIKWRTAYKEELNRVLGLLTKKYGNPLQNAEDEFAEVTHQQEIDGPLEIIRAIVEKDYKDVVTFRNGKQFDLIELLEDNLNNMDSQCSYLRSLLKQPDLHITLAAKKAREAEEARLAKIKAEQEAKEAAEKKAKEEAEAKEKARIEEEKQKAYEIGAAGSKVVEIKPPLDSEEKVIAWGIPKWGEKFQPMWINRGKVRDDDIKFEMLFNGICHTDCHIGLNHL